MFDLTSMQDATENCQYPELVGEPLRLELNFTFPVEHVTEFFVLGERMSSVAVDKFGVVGKTSRMHNVSLQQRINRFPRLNYRYHGSFPSDCVPTLDNDSFASGKISKKGLTIVSKSYNLEAKKRHSGVQKMLTAP